MKKVIIITLLISMIIISGCIPAAEEPTTEPTEPTTEPTEPITEPTETTEPTTPPSEDLEPIEPETLETINDSSTEVGDLDVDFDDVI